MKTEYSRKLAVWLAVFVFVGLAGCTATIPITEQQQKTVESADGSSIVYGVRGQGEPVIVFVHCWTCNRTF